MTEEVDISAAVLGAAGTLRTLVDGSVRLQIDFEPKDRAAVMAAFGHPGTPVACVRLRDGVAAAKDPKPAAKSSYSDLGAICREAIDLCDNEAFHRYVARLKPALQEPGVKKGFLAEQCKSFICRTCNVDSRKELDTAPGARTLFIEHIRKPFWAWLDNQGAQG